MRFNPESPNFHFRSDSREFSPIFNQAHEKAEQVFAQKQIKADDFIDVYGQETVRADQARLEQTKEKFTMDARAHEAKRVADVFEAIILDKGEDHGWLGKGVKLIKTTEFDDVFAGIDGVAQYNLAGGFEANLGLAIDVTFGHGAGRKLEKIRHRILEGQAGKIKYFKSGTFMGQKANIPRIVVGADKLVVEGLAKLWVDSDSQRQRHLVNHPVQYQILEMALLQARAFERYADRNGQTEIARSYEQIGALLERISKEKHVGGHLDVGDRDRVFNDVKDFTENALY